MTKPLVYNWVAASTAAIAPLQSLGAAGSLVLSGIYSVQNQNGANLFPMTRTLTLTSTNNLSGVNFTITDAFGFQEVIAGPISNTVETINPFSTVVSITTDAAAAAVSVGLGQVGFLQWFPADYDRTVFNSSIQIQVTGTITYSYQVTSDDVQSSSGPLVFSPIAAMTAATTNQLAGYAVPLAYSRVAITASTGAATLKATLIQQGTR